MSYRDVFLSAPRNTLSGNLFFEGFFFVCSLFVFVFRGVGSLGVSESFISQANFFPKILCNLEEFSFVPGTAVSVQKQEFPSCLEQLSHVSFKYMKHIGRKAQNIFPRLLASHPSTQSMHFRETENFTFLCSSPRSRIPTYALKMSIFSFRSVDFKQFFLSFETNAVFFKFLSEDWRLIWKSLFSFGRQETANDFQSGNKNPRFYPELRKKFRLFSTLPWPFQDCAETHFFTGSLPEFLGFTDQVGILWQIDKTSWSNCITDITAVCGWLVQNWPNHGPQHGRTRQSQGFWAHTNLHH